ncbi:MAG: helix-turn-helix domain-containing protein [Hydrogenophaga sp.]|uniref:helix-turn-helix domain-containing protein n=1 Tax=Hydrogenophaga sp. TaxID=1904254 RepID=UPI002639DCC4|nr:helix-turn-helix transcriptional regulator [Hydrogenophaga sp.]MCV0439288.1 helix-turn-helix domain-containing protein [Hydrogenophaga sp.]
MKDEGPVIAGIFGVVLQKQRIALGISQEELAFRAQVDRTFVSRLERGLRQPTITTLFSLGGALGVAPTTLVLETERLLEEAKK